MTLDATRDAVFASFEGVSPSDELRLSAEEVENGLGRTLTLTDDATAERYVVVLTPGCPSAASRSERQ